MNVTNEPQDNGRVDPVPSAARDGASALAVLPPVLALHSASCVYESNRPAIEHLTFSAQEGELLCLLGPSGCGKTTILRATAGFERVIAGSIVISGQLVSSKGSMVSPEQRYIGMVFQEYALLPHLRVNDNIAFGINHLSRAQQQAVIDDLLTLIELLGLEQRYSHELSGGQQQRVVLARVLVTTEISDFPNIQDFPAGTMVVVMIRPDVIGIISAKGANARILRRHSRRRKMSIPFNSHQDKSCTAANRPQAFIMSEQLSPCMPWRRMRSCSLDNP
ncbi:MAG: transporter, ATP-binding component, putative Fe3+ transport system [Nitrospira sp.]|jgi:ABC-type ATPase involved in cell division|nr:transporter, ATP-binding component, putative Fe3+ transport system [Nitrospira sp.]